MTRARSLTLLVALAALSFAACSTPQPPPETQSELQPEEPPQPVDVYLLPVGDFSFELCERLARELRPDVGANVRASLPMGARDLQPLPKEGQFATEDLLANAREVGSRLPNRSARSVVIALTTLDINDRSQSLRFLLAKNELATRTSVVSTARLSLSTPEVTATPERVYSRLYKMTKRAIGEQYFGLQRSSDIHDVMYAPINSLVDLDAMGTSFAKRPPAEGPSELPPPPTGFAWHKISELRAAILVPDGWHFREEHRDQTHAVFVTKDEIDADGFEVGVSLNAFLGDANAPARVKQLLDSVAAKNSVELAPGQRPPFATLSCRFESPRSGGLEPVRTLIMGIANTKTRTSYLVMFESPRSEWESVSGLGRTILDNLALESER